MSFCNVHMFGFPGKFIALLLNVCAISTVALQEGLASDTSPPELVSFDFTPKTVNVSSSSQTITVTARITDDLSGLRSLELYFYSPSGNQSVYVGFGDSRRISGTANDGVYQSTMTIPAFSEAGSWEVQSIYLSDRVGNSTNYWRDEVLAFMAARDFPSQFAVNSSASDTSPPELVSFDFTPKTVNVSSSPQTITVTARITDDLSGLNSLSAYFYSPSGNQYVYVRFSDSQRISGTANDGVYQGTMTIPVFSEAGSWEVQDIYLSDRVGNSIDYWRDEVLAFMAARDFPSQFEVLATNTAPTRTIGLSGNLAFGDVTAGQTAEQTLTIANSGNSPLTVSSITYPVGFSGAWAGTIAAGQSTNVAVTFAPTEPRSYSGTITVNSDRTAGTHTLACSGTGVQASIFAWGYNADGQTSVPHWLRDVTAIAAGGYHSLALRSDGTVVAWGYNADGQTSVPHWLRDVTAIAAGAYHSLALRSDGTIVAWGYNAFGQTSVPHWLRDVTAIAAGGFHNLALRSDGTVVAWGNNAYGQTSVPHWLRDVMAIAAGWNHNLSLGLVSSQSWDDGFSGLGFGDWRRSPWFGDYTLMGEGGWIWHIKHGFLYIPESSTPQHVWMFSQDMGWLYTGNATYPFLFRANDSTWLWYNGEVNPRWFVNMSTGAWENRP
jgi:hypothetical protein